MKTGLEAKNPSLHTSYNSRCPCHFLSNAVHKLGSKDVELVSVLDLEEIHVAVDVFYYFDNSSKKVSYENLYRSATLNTRIGIYSNTYRLTG